MEGQEKLQKGFTGLLSKIGDVIADAAALDVTTFTGDFTYQANSIINNGADKAEISNVLRKMALKSQTDIQLVAHTSVKIDADVSTIVKKNLTETDRELLKLHQEMITASREARRSIISMVTDLLSK